MTEDEELLLLPQRTRGEPLTILPMVRTIAGAPLRIPPELANGADCLWRSVALAARLSLLGHEVHVVHGTCSTIEPEDAPHGNYDAHVRYSIEEVEELLAEKGRVFDDRSPFAHRAAEH